MQNNFDKQIPEVGKEILMIPGNQRAIPVP